MRKRGPKPAQTPYSATPRESLEAFCCIQVERIEQRLWHRYGADATKPDGYVDNRHAAMPQNDHITRLNPAECDFEHRR